MSLSRCTRCKQCKQDVALLEDPYVAVVFGETKEQLMCQDCFQVRMLSLTNGRSSRSHGLLVGALTSVRQRFQTSAAT